MVTLATPPLQGPWSALQGPTADGKHEGTHGSPSPSPLLTPQYRDHACDDPKLPPDSWGKPASTQAGTVYTDLLRAPMVWTFSGELF